MLTQLATVKSRLGLSVADTQYDTLLTNAIKAVSARFDKETNRTLARTQDATHEFPSADTEVSPACYPIESVSKFELKFNETDGWTDQPNVQYLIRRNCVISLPSPLSTINSQPSTARVTYTGGYLLPSDPNYQQSTPDHQLPQDLEQAAVEQVAFWFQSRDKLGLHTSWPSGGEYKQFATLDLLPSVSAVLTRYQRLAL